MIRITYWNPLKKEDEEAQETYLFKQITTFQSLHIYHYRSDNPITFPFPHENRSIICNLIINGQMHTLEGPPHQTSIDPNLYLLYNDTVIMEFKAIKVNKEDILILDNIQCDQ